MIRLPSITLVALLVPTAAAQAQCGGLSLRQLGAQQSFDLLVRSNSGYQVSFQSAESSTMRKSPPNPDNVSYTVTVGGNPADLSSGAGVVVASASGVTPVNGDRHAVSFAVGTVSGHRTGSYADNVTVTVSAL